MPTSPTSPLEYAAAMRQTQPFGFVRRTNHSASQAPDQAYALAGAVMAFNRKTTGRQTDVHQASALQEAARLFSARQRRLL